MTTLPPAIRYAFALPRHHGAILKIIAAHLSPVTIFDNPGISRLGRSALLTTRRRFDTVFKVKKTKTIASRINMFRQTGEDEKI
jgi:hypothetical protein